MNYSQRQSDPRRHLVGISAVIAVPRPGRVCPGDGPCQEGRRRRPGADRDQGDRGDQEAAAAARDRRAAAAQARGAAAAVHPAARDPDRHAAAAAPTITATTPTPPPAPVVIAPAPPPVVGAARAAAGAARRRHRGRGRAPTTRGDGRRRLSARGACARGIERGEALIQFTLTRDRRDQGHQGRRRRNPIFARNSVRIVQANSSARDRAATSRSRVPFVYKVE